MKRKNGISNAVLHFPTIDRNSKSLKYITKIFTLSEINNVGHYFKKKDRY